ncbi:hypothetical protein ES705_06109 [subsurface metagenome]
MSEKKQNIKRNYSRYILKRGNKIVYFGVTNDLKRRLSEHKRAGLKFNSMSKNGPTVSKQSAFNWEIASIKKYKKSHSGKSPEYNK